VAGSSGPTYLVLLGAPGAGKGTQASFLSQKLGLPHVASGDLFREAIAQQTELGLLAKGYMDRGELVPDGVTIAMVMERLERRDCAQGARRLALVPYIKVSEETLLRRLAGRWTCKECGAIYHQSFTPPRRAGLCDACDGVLYQRADDTPETQRRRIRVYFEQTSPLIEYFRERGLLVEIDGEGSVEDVGRALLQAIKGLKRGSRH
jgi:adenylate kinase